MSVHVCMICAKTACRAVKACCYNCVCLHHWLILVWRHPWDLLKVCFSHGLDFSFNR